MRSRSLCVWPPKAAYKSAIVIPPFSSERERNKLLPFNSIGVTL